ncbi:DEAD/DEAH box helicase [Shewanella corallii]|uniref:ATP-dependent RNA helicase RhlE n=1 Tax=Shewanella corallii TaxID=560080 RepID=A0ABT0N6B5_9GAMM|nr:DEAD/DEAH box helicase [Shewanella corallii]MCL2913920.1 DEAD/DEAH box helicase [Shewanella corallii]
MSFSSLGLSAPILKAVAEQGYETPSPIQAQAIPAVLTGRDVMAAAQTGTGKTAGFTLPLLEKLSGGKRPAAGQIRALIITPTRELAAQIDDNVTAYRKYLKLRNTVVFGGVSINPQITALKRGVDILVATPGRLLDLHAQKAVAFDSLEVLVLDEADRMLDMGFIHDIRRILKVLPAKRQNLMFSATFSEEIRALAKGLIQDPVEISVTPRNTTAQTVEQWIYPVEKSQKPALLTELIKSNDWRQVLVFSRTKHGANRLAKYLDSKDISSVAIHGNKSQNARTAALANFKSGTVKVMVATDIAARGLDIDQLPQVVNFDLPNVPEDYVHRIGRTGRAGASGQAVSLVCGEEVKQLRDIEKLIGRHIDRKEVDGFAPAQALPQTQLTQNTKSNQGNRQANGGKPANRNRRAQDKKADDRVLSQLQGENKSSKPKSQKPRQGNEQARPKSHKKPHGKSPQGTGANQGHQPKRTENSQKSGERKHKRDSNKANQGNGGESSGNRRTQGKPGNQQKQQADKNPQARQPRRQHDAAKQGQRRPRRSAQNSEQKKPQE